MLTNSVEEAIEAAKAAPLFTIEEIVAKMMQQIDENGLDEGTRTIASNAMTFFKKHCTFGDTKMAYVCLDDGPPNDEVFNRIPLLLVDEPEESMTVLAFGVPIATVKWSTRIGWIVMDGTSNTCENYFTEFEGGPPYTGAWTKINAVKTQQQHF